MAVNDLVSRWEQMRNDIERQLGRFFVPGISERTMERRTLRRRQSSAYVSCVESWNYSSYETADTKAKARFLKDRRSSPIATVCDIRILDQPCSELPQRARRHILCHMALRSSMARLRHGSSKNINAPILLRSSRCSSAASRSNSGPTTYR